MHNTNFDDVVSRFQGRGFWRVDTMPLPEGHEACLQTSAAEDSDFPVNDLTDRVLLRRGDLGIDAMSYSNGLSTFVLIWCYEGNNPEFEPEQLAFAQISIATKVNVQVSITFPYVGFLPLEIACVFVGGLNEFMNVFKEFSSSA